MIDVPCYICGSAKHAPYASENGFRLVKCVSCGLLYVTPRPDATEIAEAHKYGVHAGKEKLDVSGGFRSSNVANYLDMLETLYGDGLCEAEGRWLDIGCGHGEFLVALRRYSAGGIKGYGLEPNVHKQKSARSLGLDVDYFDLASHDGRYEYLSLLNVYSHLPDPTVSLGDWKHLLKPGGELLLQTGDTADMTNREHYRPFSLPDHLSFASEAILVRLLKSLGFEVLDIVKYPFPRLDFLTLGKEAAKLVWPGKHSMLGYMVSNFVRQRKTDLYIRACLKA